MSKEAWDWKEHVSLGIGAVSSMVIVIRLLSIADFNLETAYAILKSAGTAAVIIGTLFSSLWAFMCLILLYLLAVYMRSPVHYKEVPKVIRSVGAIAGTVMVITAPFFFTASLAAIAALTAIAAVSLYALFRNHELVNIDKSAEIYARAGRIYATILTKILIPAFLIGTLIFTQPWLPSERVTIDNVTRTGYVLDVNETTMTFLQETSRKIEYIPIKDRTVYRQVCRRYGEAKSSLDKPLFAAIFQVGAKYPQCL
jgi:hypothetical protein